MTDPNLVDDYLSVVRQALKPPVGVQERVEARLEPLPSVPSVAGVPDVPGVAPSMIEATRRHRTIGVVAGGIALLLVGFMSGHATRGTSEIPPPLPAPKQATPAVIVDAELAPSEPVTLESATLARENGAESQAVVARAKVKSSGAVARPKARDTSVASVQPADAPSTLSGSAQPADAPSTISAADELALLRRAERAVRAGNSALALMLVSELDAKHPRSGFMEERRAIELMAFCAAGATDSKRRAERFALAHPHSVYEEHIATLCTPKSNPTDLAASDKPLGAAH